MNLYEVYFFQTVHVHMYVPINMYEVHYRINHTAILMNMYEVSSTTTVTVAYKYIR